MLQVGKLGPMLEVRWNGEMAFAAKSRSGVELVMDASPAVGGKSRGPTPVETLLASIAACSGMDVISILVKKRQKVSAYRIEIDGERVPPGEWPRPFLSMTVRHIVSGEALDPAAVQRAVELSDAKYCSVIATLRGTPPISSEWRIE